MCIPLVAHWLVNKYEEQNKAYRYQALYSLQNMGPPSSSPYRSVHMVPCLCDHTLDFDKQRINSQQVLFEVPSFPRGIFTLTNVVIKWTGRHRTSHTYTHVRCSEIVVFFHVNILILANYLTKSPVDIAAFSFSRPPFFSNVSGTGDNSFCLTKFTGTKHTIFSGQHRKIYRNSLSIYNCCPGFSLLPDIISNCSECSLYYLPVS